MPDILYSEGTNRVPLTDALTKALGKLLGETAPYYRNKEGEKVRVPVKYAFDEVNYTEYSTPEIVIFNPVLKKNRYLTTNQVVYRDYDYNNLTAKEFHEPIPVKIIFTVHVATRNPDNDMKLNEYLMKLEDIASFLDAEIMPELGQYDRHQVIWEEPTALDSTDISKIREVKGTVHAWLEILDYKEVRLLAPGDAIGLVHESYEGTKYSLFAKTAQELYITDENIQTVDSLVGFPVSGVIQIEDDIITYTSRTKYKFLGISGVTIFHNFNTEINFVS